MASPALVQSRSTDRDGSLLVLRLTYQHLNTGGTDPVLNERVVASVILDELAIHLEMSVLQCHHTISTDIQSMQLRSKLSNGQEIHFQHFVA